MGIIENLKKALIETDAGVCHVTMENIKKKKVLLLLFQCMTIRNLHIWYFRSCMPGPNRITRK